MRRLARVDLNLAWLPPRGVLWVIVAYVAGLAVYMAYPPVLFILPLQAPLLVEPINPLRLLSYPFLHVSGPHLVLVAVFTWVTAVTLRGRLTGPAMLVALLAGSIVGGVVFGLVARFEVVTGGYLPAWGLAGAAAGGFLRDRSRFGGWRLGYVAALPALAMVAVGAGRITPVAVLAAAAAGAVVGFRAIAVRTTVEGV